MIGWRRTWPGSLRAHRVVGPRCATNKPQRSALLRLASIAFTWLVAALVDRSQVYGQSTPPGAGPPSYYPPVPPQGVTAPRTSSPPPRQMPPADFSGAAPPSLGMSEPPKPFSIPRLLSEVEWFNPQAMPPIKFAPRTIEQNEFVDPAAYLDSSSDYDRVMHEGGPRLEPLPAVPNGPFIPPPPPPRSGFFKGASFLKTLIPGHTGNNVSFADLAVKATFGTPLPNIGLYGANPLAAQPGMFLITPGFTAHLLDGPQTGGEAPGHLFDSNIDLRWVGRVTPGISYDLAVTPGLYGDYSFVGWHTLRVAGRGLGIFTLNPTTQLAAGVVYLDRVDIKLLPAGGLIWTPNESWRFELVFPRPIIATLIASTPRAQWWGHVAGELGGYSYTFTRSSGEHDILTYRDYRVLFGLERRGCRGHTIFWEAGFVFGRILKYESGAPNVYPGDTALLRTGTVY